MAIRRTVEPIKRLWSFGEQLDLLNGYDALGDS
jgi:hypothetical protein